MSHTLDLDPVNAAQQLLGGLLHHSGVALRITEVEAYSGALDPASHAYRGRTPRNAAMFGLAGRLYVYRSHGLHWCANVVTGEEGTASAVLIRAGEVVEGLALARERRGARVADRDLARGPGRLCQALGIDGMHDGADLIGGTSPRLVIGAPLPASSIAVGPRVGVSRGADTPWRYWIAGDRYVSAYRRSPRAV